MSAWINYSRVTSRVGYRSTSKQPVRKDVRHIPDKMPANSNARALQCTGSSRITASMQLALLSGSSRITASMQLALLSATCSAVGQKHTLPVMTSAVIVLAKPKQANRPLRFCIL